MSKPWGDPSCGTSSEDVLIPTERHPAYRQREARSGSGTERENLADDAKGKGASGSHREAESTDASERGGLPQNTWDPKTPILVEIVTYLFNNLKDLLVSANSPNTLLAT